MFNRLFNNKTKKIPRIEIITERENWTEADREVLNAFLNGSTGSKMIKLFNYELTSLSLKIDPLSPLDDGIRMGGAQTLSAMHDLSIKIPEDDEDDMYSLTTDYPKKKDE